MEIIDFDMVKTASSGFGKIIGCVQSRCATVFSFRFDSPVCIKQEQKYGCDRDSTMFNSYTGAFARKNDEGILSARIRTQNGSETYFMSKDGHYFLFEFSLFFLNDDEVLFKTKDLETQRTEIIQEMTSFFERLSKHGVSIWFPERFSHNRCEQKEMEAVLERMEKWYYGKYIKN